MIKHGSEEIKIDAQITIKATYEDSITIELYDKISGTHFCEIELTNEQFVNAAMNRLGNTGTKSAFVCGLDRLGKVEVRENFEFEIPDCFNNGKMYAIENIRKLCPEGWTPDISFTSRDSFFDRNDKHYARTMIRKWI
jgi:hypothetical protein